MRWLAILAAGLCLAGCGAAELSKRPPQLTQALEAYRSGDIGRLQAIEAEAEALAAAELAAPGGDDPCTDQGMKAVKASAVAFIVGRVNHPTVTSMSPEARYLYLQKLGGGNLDREDIPATIRLCKADDSQVRALRDLMTAMSVVTAMQGEMEDWAVDLQAQYGDEYGARMKAAQVTLARNGVLGREEARWATRRTR